MNDEPGRQLKSRIEIVDYMRGIAAAAVAWFHFTNTYPDGVVRSSGAYGWLGVEVFFVISGFVIPYSLVATYGRFRLKDAPSFLAKRMVRLEPPYLASILLAVGLWRLSSLSPGFRGESLQIHLGQIAAHLLYLIPLTEFDWIQPIYWTLAYEFVFYAVMSVLFPLIGGREQSGAWYACVLCLGLACAIGLLPMLALLFVLGGAAYRRISLAESPILTAVTAALCLCVMWCGGNLIEGVVGALAMAGILAGRRLVIHSSLLGRLLSRLATLSYSLYLVHVPVGGRVVNLGRRFFAGEAAQLMLSLLALAISLVAAYVFWRLVESPSLVAARSLGRRLGKPRAAGVVA